MINGAINRAINEAINWAINQYEVITNKQIKMGFYHTLSPDWIISRNTGRNNGCEIRMQNTNKDSSSKRGT